jgi:hypothetical protein
MEINEKKVVSILVGLTITCFIFFGLRDLNQRS